MDYEKFRDEYSKYEIWNIENEEPRSFLGNMKRALEKSKAEDRVNNPSHYQLGPFETIDIIEAAIEDAPFNKAAVL